MISFSRLGQLGRFGNQLFQYAYLRSQAERLGVQYSCPPWIGDKLFELNESQRIVSNIKCKNVYKEPAFDYGFHKSALMVQDQTEVLGFFQTSKYFGNKAKEWYSFPENRLKPELTDYVGMHLRFGDYINLRHIFTRMTHHYYQHCLEKYDTEKIIVFSDDIPKAKFILSGLKNRDIEYYEEGLSDIDDFFALASCSGQIISNSTFAWWAAYLSPIESSKYKKQNVCFPKYWFNPNCRRKNSDITHENWCAITHTE